MEASYFPFLRHMITAYEKMPKYTGTVWRGVKGDLSHSAQLMSPGRFMLPSMRQIRCLRAVSSLNNYYHRLANLLKEFISSRWGKSGDNVVRRRMHAIISSFWTGDAEHNFGGLLPPAGGGRSEVVTDH